MILFESWHLDTVLFILYPCSSAKFDFIILNLISAYHNFYWSIFFGSVHIQTVRWNAKILIPFLTEGWNNSEPPEDGSKAKTHCRVWKINNIYHNLAMIFLYDVSILFWFCDSLLAWNNWFHLCFCCFFSHIDLVGPIFGYNHPLPRKFHINLLLLIRLLFKSCSVLVYYNVFNFICTGLLNLVVS